MESFGDLLDRWLRKNNAKQRVDAASVFGRWRDVVGEELSRETRVVDLRAGELTIEVSSSALLNEMSTYGRQDILEALRGMEEFRGVKKLRFRLGTS